MYLQNKQYGEAVKRLVPFRDNGQFNNIPGLTDRALLRLGHSYAAVKAWGESQQAMERVMNQFGNSPWVDDARYGRAWARQQMGDFDGAVEGYNQVATRSATELAAKAQYQIGTCRMAQKKWNDAANAFLVVPTTFDYPELCAASLLEAAQAYRELDQRDQSSRLLQRIVTDYAGTPFADLAKEQLEQKMTRLKAKQKMQIRKCKMKTGSGAAMSDRTPRFAFSVLHFLFCLGLIDAIRLVVSGRFDHA